MDLSAVVGTAYCKDDLYRPKDEGRSLHDESAYFFRNIFKLPQNVPSSVLPTVDVIFSYEIYVTIYQY